MYIDTLSTTDVIVLCSGLSLCWFVVGVVAGKRIPDIKIGKKSVRQSGHRRRSNQNGSGKTTEIYVGNLSYDMSEKGLAKAFEKYGDVASARIIRNKANNKSKGFGFVQMADKGEAEAAVKGLHGKDLAGRKLVVNEAKSRARR